MGIVTRGHEGFECCAGKLRVTMNGRVAAGARDRAISTFSIGYRITVSFIETDLTSVEVDIAITVTHTAVFLEICIDRAACSGETARGDFGRVFIASRALPLAFVVYKAVVMLAQSIGFSLA